MYFSSLLATLNRREKIRTQMEGTAGIVSVPLHSSAAGRSGWPKGVSFIAFKPGGVESLGSSGTASHHGGVVEEPQRQIEIELASGGDVVIEKEVSDSKHEMV